MVLKFLSSEAICQKFTPNILAAHKVITIFIGDLPYRAVSKCAQDVARNITGSSIVDGHAVGRDSKRRQCIDNQARYSACSNTDVEDTRMGRQA